MYTNCSNQCFSSRFCGMLVGLVFFAVRITVLCSILFDAFAHFSSLSRHFYAGFANFMSLHDDDD